MLKISYAASPCLSQLASAQFAVEICFAAQIKLPKIHNCQNPILAFKVIEFDGNREPVYDFLLVPRPYLAPLLTLAIFPTPFSALVRGHPFRIYGKVLRFLKLESSRQPTVKIW